MINLIANKKFKNLGAKWNGREWIAPKLAQKEFDEIKKEFYEDLIVVEISHDDKKHEDKLKGQDWTLSCHCRTVAGYVVATAKGRDSGAELIGDTVVIEGNFKSGGSIKNFMCDHTGIIKIRLEISRNALKYLDDEVKENRFDYQIL